MELKQLLVGAWDLKRDVKLADSMAIYATGNGIAFFYLRNNDNRLFYRENGNLTLTENKQEYAFFRNFSFEFSDKYISIFFEDGINKGKLYHRCYFDHLNSKIVPIDKHLCANDIYETIYTLVTKNELQITTSIYGPKKGFLIETILSRK